MKSEVKMPLVVVAVLAAVALAAFSIMKFAKSGDLDQGQVQYTPGVPPWQEKDPEKLKAMNGLGSHAAGAGATAPHGAPGP